MRQMFNIIRNKDIQLIQQMLHSQKQFLSDYEYGTAGSGLSEANSNYNSMYNASLNVNKQEIAKGRKRGK